MNMQQLVDGFGKAGKNRSVFVHDLKSGAQAGYRADEARLAASVLKLPLAMRVAEKFADGSLRRDEAVMVAELDKSEWSNILAVLERPIITLGEVAAFSIALSDNACASFLLKRVGADEVNDLMARLGCGGGNHIVHGFTDDELNTRKKQHDNMLTARGAAKLLEQMWTQDIYAPVRPWLRHGLRGPRVRMYLEPDVYNKTGGLSGVVNDVAVVHEGDRALIITVFTEGEIDSGMAAVEIGKLALAVWQS